MSEKNKELLLIFTQYSETFVAMIKLSSVQGCHECQSVSVRGNNAHSMPLTSYSLNTEEVFFLHRRRKRHWTALSSSQSA